MIRIVFPLHFTPLSRPALPICQLIQLAGLMTIGAFDHDLSKGPNPDFQRLIAARVKVCQALELNVEDLELSMGMSNDVS